MLPRRLLLARGCRAAARSLTRPRAVAARPPHLVGRLGIARVSCLSSSAGSPSGGSSLGRIKIAPRALRCLSSSAGGPSGSDAASTWGGWLRHKVGHVRTFFLSYFAGLKLFGSEVRAATRLAWRVYGQGKRTSRQERQAMQRSVGELARVVPLAGLFLVFGLELTTVAILRFAPSLLPKSMRQEVEPAAEQMGIAPKRADGAARIAHRLALCADLVGGAQQIADDHDLARAAELLARVRDDDAHVGAHSGDHLSASAILDAASDFGDGTPLELDALPKTMLRMLAELHLPSEIRVPLLGPVAAGLTPDFVRRRLLREKINSLRDDDKELAWGGSVALQAAATTTWQAWPWPYASTEAVAPATLYALAMTSASVCVVATAREIAVGVERTSTASAPPRAQTCLTTSFGAS